MWDPVWEELFRTRGWGRYPSEDLVRFMARTFPEPARVRVLELGCGPGANLWYLAREGFRVVGLDGSPTALAECWRRLRAEGLHACLVRADAARLPFPAASFDVVLDVECLYANPWEAARRAVAEAARVLVPGGWLWSKTFAPGTSGEGDGEPAPGEPGAWRRLRSGPLAGKGFTRFTPRERLPALYQPLELVAVDETSRTDGPWRVREWLVACRRLA